jgi:GntR family transcriptional repressor for pyruvate dehydrogenase complex
LHREALAELLGEITGGTLPAGSRLPTEVAMAERFEISRGVARECFRALEERGVITVKHGSATTVNERERWDLFDPDVLVASLAGPGAAALLGDYLECRRIIEVDAAGLAAERATDAQRAELARRFEVMVAALKHLCGSMNVR